MGYLTGFFEEPGERHLFLILSADADPVFFIPDLYETQVREATFVDDINCWSDDTNPVDRLADLATEFGLADSQVLVDDRMWATFTQDIRTAAPGVTLGLASEVLAPVRRQKDGDELAAMRRAATAADETIKHVREMGSSVLGMTEAELAAVIERLLAEHGGTGVAFEPIVGSGPNGAKPHHRHEQRKIEPGDPVVLDFGTRVDGYPSDQTRTLVFGGDPPEQFQEVHRLVQAALEAGVAAVEPGVSAQTVDRAARDVIESAGYGEAFVHRTGHGVGLDVHEEPFITEGNETQLKPGMVFSVEPAVYLPDAFGVRIEDLVVVTADGCERLNHTDRGWKVLSE